MILRFYTKYSQKNSEETILYKPKQSYRTKGRGGESSLTAGTNLPNGVIVHYYLKKFDSEKDKVELQFKSNDGELIKKYSTDDKKNKLNVKEGGNSFVWDTRYDGAEKLEGMIFWSASFSGAKAVPGSYSVSLLINGQEKVQKFDILADPRSESSIEDMQKQFNFVNEVNQTVDDAHKAIKKIRNITAKLTDFVKQNEIDSSATKLVDQAKEIKQNLINVEKTLYQTQNRSNQDPLNFPIRLTNKLGHLNRLITLDDFPPTNQDLEVKDVLALEIKKAMELFNKLIENDVAAFNTNFKNEKRNYLIIK